MKKNFKTILSIVVTFLAIVSFTSCGNSNSTKESYSSTSSDSLSQLTGTWQTTWNDDGTLNKIQIEVNSSGKGYVKFSYSGRNDMDWITMINEKVTFERDGNVLYWQTSHGETGSFEIKNNEIYTADGRRLSKQFY